VPDCPILDILDIERCIRRRSSTAAQESPTGGPVHGFNQTIEWRIIGLLATGSIPATALALAVLSWLDLRSGGASHLITAVLSIVLLLTAGALISRNKISALYAHRLPGLDDRSIAGLTIVMGALVGILVTFSSVGAGAIGVMALVILYPSVPAARIVGSDIAHAVPLTLMAGLGYGVMGADQHCRQKITESNFGNACQNRAANEDAGE